MAAYPDIPESVQDSRWEADFEPNSHVPYQTTNTLLTGRRLLRRETWIRQKQLGHGGFGVVWLEKAHSANRSVVSLRAVKELRVSREDVRRHECIRELQALVKFSHRKFVGSFVEFYSWYESNDALFIAMEYCRHGDLRQFVKDNGAIVEVDVQKITDQVLQALMFMHENNFAHRDLKPANILIQRRPPDNEWKIKVGDMGLSKRIGIEASSTTVRGTPGFIAPERVPGIGSNPSTTDPFPCDIWCLGEVAFFLLTGEKTFDSPTQLQGYYNGIQGFPEERLHTATISYQAIDFIKSLMAAQPSRRLSAFEADYHSWMSDIDISNMADHRRVSDTTRDPYYHSSKLPLVHELPEMLNDIPQNELTPRGITVPDPPRHATDTRSVPSGSWDTSTVQLPPNSSAKPKSEHSKSNQRTMSIASGTWNSSTTHPVPASGDHELPAAKSFDQGWEMDVRRNEDDEESTAGTEGYRPDTRPIFRKTPIYRIDANGRVWTVVRQSIVRDEKTGRAHRQLTLDGGGLGEVDEFEEPDFYETVEADPSTDDGEEEEEDYDDEVFVSERTRKYEAMLEFAIRYITRSASRPSQGYYDYSETLPEEDDADDEDVFWSGDEEPSPDHKAKKVKQDDTGIGSEIDIAGNRRAKSPRDMEAYAGSEEGVKQSRVKHAPPFEEREIKYSSLPYTGSYPNNIHRNNTGRDRATPSPRNVEARDAKEEENKSMPQFDGRGINYGSLPYRGPYRDDVIDMGAYQDRNERIKYPPRIERNVYYEDPDYKRYHRNEVYGASGVVVYTDKDGKIKPVSHLGERDIDYIEIPYPGVYRRSHSPREVEARSDVNNDRMTHSLNDAKAHIRKEETENLGRRREKREKGRTPRRAIAYIEDVDDEDVEDDDRTELSRPIATYGSDDGLPDEDSRERARSPYPIASEDDALTRTARWLSTVKPQPAAEEGREGGKPSNYKSPTVEDAENSD
ncbi:hypothetical protein NPX13_g3653 [Xylaria arbuscula]|uniref:Protein kinase domain-containing protein n=1 Tax=Xylaria arbuscula TaxID=114810 RepID=A0A9W8NHC7_9PEZI|nr:hypothetical protein NPX13_g3653 [Xylaria arbuscula]